VNALREGERKGERERERFHFSGTVPLETPSLSLR
jgi:hypothetical protein